MTPAPTLVLIARFSTCFLPLKIKLSDVSSTVTVVHEPRTEKVIFVAPPPPPRNT